MKTWKRAETTFIIVGNAMRKSADQQIDTIRRSLGSSFVVAADTQNESLYEEYISDGEQLGSVFAGKKITSQLVEQILNIDGIVDYEVKDYLPVWTNVKLKEAGWVESTPDENFSEENLELQRSSTNAIFCGNGEMNVNFRIGAVSVSAGRNILKDDKSTAVISEYLAEKNNLSVGDSIILETKRGLYEPAREPFETLGEPERLEIVGIFSVNFEQEISMFTNENECVDNFIFIDQYTGSQFKKNLETLFPGNEAYNEVTFFVQSSEILEDVLEKAEQEVDLSGLKVSLDDSAYSASVKPLRQIHMFAVILIASGSIGCVVILYLILSLWIKGRIHETGILISIGIGKRSILWQMILECIIIATIAVFMVFFLQLRLSQSYFSRRQQKLLNQNQGMKTILF